MAAIPENLLESELFGHERGAFTGAVNSKAGKFEIANGGTLLLDEISEMDIRLQAKLLRALQENEVDRIGSRKPVKVDVRIVATTNKNLADLISEGLFREDLFYRLNVVNLTIPPLRERVGDIRNLAKYFLDGAAKKNHKSVDGFMDEAFTLLESHNWPGNVRELENMVSRAAITTKNTIITPSDIHIEKIEKMIDDSDEMGLGAKAPWSPGQTLNDIERNVIIEALQYHNGNRTHTARALGISIRTLRNKLADYRRLGIYI